MRATLDDATATLWLVLTLFFLILLLTLRRLLRHWLARHHLVTHRCVVGERGDDHRGLLEVILHRVIEGVEVRVVGPRKVVELILDELKAGQPHGVEGAMVDRRCRG